MANQFLLKLKPLEISILVYIGLSSLLIIAYSRTLQNIEEHLTVRIFVVLSLIAFILFHKSIQKNGWIKVIRLFAPLLLLTYFYTETDYLNNLIFRENLDPLFSGLEETIFGVQWAEKFSELITNNLFAELMYLGYFSYYLLIIGIPLILYCKFGYQTTEKAIFIILNSFFIYYLIFIIFPVAGPQFYFENSIKSLPKGYIFGELIRLIQDMGEAPTAAFPSSHVSICLMLVWLCFKNLKKLLFLVIPIAILLLFSTVYIKAHYVIDVLAAFITTPIIYAISNKLHRYFTLIIKPYDHFNTRG